MQRVNVTIFDDNIVEDFESINLKLTAENPDVVIVQQNVAIINIVDNDGMINITYTVWQYNVTRASIYLDHAYLSYHLVAIIDFEQFNYTFPEGSIGSVCITIVNPVVLGMEVSPFPAFFCMFSVHSQS